VLDNKSGIIEVNQMLCRKIVYAINKAVADDIPSKMQENRLETNNRYIFATGDYINENLRKHVVKDEVELIPFSRYAWEGRIIVDRANKVTYTISTYHALNAVIRKKRNKQHYLQSILYVENGDYEGTNKQMTIYDISPEYRENTFDVAELEEDYDNIMHGRISRTDGYKHYIIVYEKEHHEISNIEMLLLDKDFVVVDKISLMEYVNPDFASLTEDVYENIENTKEDEVEAKPLLLKLKPGVKPELKAIAEEA
jgi:hypothetical protein